MPAILLGAGTVTAGVLMATGGLRIAQVELAHAAVHKRLFKNKSCNDLVGDLFTTIALSQNLKEYWRDHVVKHHDGRRVFATLQDPDVAFLFELGLRPGKSAAAIKRRLLRTLISPRFHAKFFCGRLRSNFVTATFRRKVAATIWAMTLAGMGFVTIGMTLSVITFVCVWIIGYQISALLQFFTEHRWYAPLVAGESPARRHLRLSHARWCGDAPPPKGAPNAERARRWVVWWLRLVLIHIPARVAVLVGGLSAHGEHHRMFASDWANQCIEHVRAAVSGSEVTDEIWGLDRAVDEIAHHIASMPGISPPST